MKKTAEKEYVWIIGASAGIGAELAKEYANGGDVVAISARSEDALNKLEAEMLGSEHIVASLDVADYESVVKAKDKITDKWSRVDRVIFMAGIYQPMKLGELDLQESKKILEVNLLGALNVVEVALPLIDKANLKQVALCASVAGYRGLPKGQPYGASKAGLINIAESLRAEHGKHVDVKVINPGFVESRLTDKNDFEMPMKISADKAAEQIKKGLYSNGFEVHFPKRFTYLMKLLAALPNWLYFRIV